MHFKQLSISSYQLSNSQIMLNPAHEDITITIEESLRFPQQSKFIQVSSVNMPYACSDRLKAPPTIFDLIKYQLSNSQIMLNPAYEDITITIESLCFPQQSKFIQVSSVNMPYACSDR
jgi:hypothetical protein